MQDTIASCSEDQKVKIWRRTPAVGGNDHSKDEWAITKEIDIKTPAWKVSWS